MDPEEVNYRNLRKIQQLETNTPTLTKIHNTFYKDLTNYLINLDQRIEKENNEQKKILLREEIHNTKKIAQNVYDQREKKIILAAISSARGGNPNLENLIETEKTLYESILTNMINSREKIFSSNKTEQKEENEENKIENIEEENIEQIEEETNDANTNPIVLLNQDIPEFIGTDEKKYNLRKNDVTSISKGMYDTLSKRNVVTEIKYQKK